MSVVRIGESPYYGVFFFLKKIYENFIGTVETVRIREVSVPRGIVLFLNGNTKQQNEIKGSCEPAHG